MICVLLKMDERNDKLHDLENIDYVGGHSISVFHRKESGDGSYRHHRFWFCHRTYDRQPSGISVSWGQGSVECIRSFFAAHAWPPVGRARNTADGCSAAHCCCLPAHGDESRKPSPQL